MIDLLFKAHLERGTAFEIEIIARDRQWARESVQLRVLPRDLRRSRRLRTLGSRAEPENPFKTWLKYKSLARLGEEVERTKNVTKGSRSEPDTYADKQKAAITSEHRPIPVKKFIDDYLYRIDLDADYQREKIWSRGDQEKLIDSIIQNIDIPKIYLARIEDKENFDFECIDGKQRMATLLNFFKPEQSTDSPLTVRVPANDTRISSCGGLATLADKIDEYELTFVIYPQIDDDEFIREIFRRLQLGVRLNSGEMLKSHMGTLRDFIYKEMGKEAPFLRRTKLSEKRFAKQFTLAQICINSFSRNESGDFVRARYDDLEDFFKDKYDLEENDANLNRIRAVLKIMEKHFGDEAREYFK